MSILAQNNPLRFYSDKRSRQWENTGSQDRIVTYKMYLDGAVKKCVIPNFSFILGVYPSSSSIEIRVKDCDDNLIYTSPFAVGITIISNTTYFQLIYSGGEFEHDVEGYYYIEIDVDSDTYYSDMFRFSDDLDRLLKVYTESTKIRLGTYEYEMIYNIHEFYLNLKPLSINTYLKEDANETYAITNINFGSSSLLRSFNVLASEPIFMFLRTLRILSCNGVVLFDYRYINYQASDIVIEIENDVENGDLMNVKIEFKVLTESVSAIN
jgi:hypothetical protein